VKLCLYNWSKNGSKIFLSKERKEKAWDLPGGKFSESEIEHYLQFCSRDKPNFEVLKVTVLTCLFRELQEELGLTFGLKAIAPSLRITLSTSDPGAWAIVIPMWAESTNVLPGAGLKPFYPNDLMANIFDVYQHVLRIFGHVCTWRKTQLTSRVVPHFPPSFAGKPVHDRGFFVLTYDKKDMIVYSSPRDQYILKDLGLHASETEIGSAYYDLADTLVDLPVKYAPSRPVTFSRSVPPSLQPVGSVDVSPKTRQPGPDKSKPTWKSEPLRPRSASEAKELLSPREYDEWIRSEWIGDHEYRTDEDVDYIGFETAEAEVIAREHRSKPS
jgi:8-oxo-dGTP pyrophosphatase MutT (NUDIX family)